MCRRIAALFLLPCCLAACFQWKPATEPLAQAVKATQGSRDALRVTLANGQQYTVTMPFIDGDTLRGFREGNQPDPVSLPLSAIQLVEVRRVKAGQTALLVTASVLVAVAAISSATSASPPPPPPAGDGIGQGCPLVYSWDGSRWRLDSGTFGGAIAPTLARTDVDLLDYARVEGGRLRLRLSTELNETDHTDAIRVVAVDHAPGLSVAPDAGGRLHTVGRLTPPVAAHDFRGRDALARVREQDAWNWESVPSGRDSSRLADVRDGLELVFPRPAGVLQAQLVVDGENSAWAPMMLGEFVSWHGRATEAWYDSLETQPALARGLADLITGAGALAVSVWDGSEWRAMGYIGVAGPEVSKRQVAVLDLTGIRGDSVHVRLEGTPSFWLVDRVAIDYSTPQPFVERTAVFERGIDDRGRDVSTELATVDGRDYVTERGDAAELSFRAPPLPGGMARSWVLRSTGWYRLHTDETGEPQTALLDRVTRDPLAAARVAVGRASELVAASAGGHR